MRAMNLSGCSACTPCGRSAESGKSWSFVVTMRCALHRIAAARTCRSLRSGRHRPSISRSCPVTMQSGTARSMRCRMRSICSCGMSGLALRKRPIHSRWMVSVQRARNSPVVASCRSRFRRSAGNSTHASKTTVKVPCTAAMPGGAISGGRGSRRARRARLAPAGGSHLTAACRSSGR